MRRHHAIILVVCGVLLVLGIFIIVGALNGGDAGDDLKQTPNELIRTVVSLRLA